MQSPRSSHVIYFLEGTNDAHHKICITHSHNIQVATGLTKGITGWRCGGAAYQRYRLFHVLMQNCNIALNDEWNYSA